MAFTNGRLVDVTKCERNRGKGSNLLWGIFSHLAAINNQLLLSTSCWIGKLESVIIAYTPYMFNDCLLKAAFWCNPCTLDGQARGLVMPRKLSKWLLYQNTWYAGEMPHKAYVLTSVGHAARTAILRPAVPRPCRFFRLHLRPRGWRSPVKGRS